MLKSSYLLFNTWWRPLKICVQDHIIKSVNIVVSPGCDTSDHLMNQNSKWPPVNTDTIPWHVLSHMPALASDWSKLKYPIKRYANGIFWNRKHDLMGTNIHVACLSLSCILTLIPSNCWIGAPPCCCVYDGGFHSDLQRVDWVMVKAAIVQKPRYTIATSVLQTLHPVNLILIRHYK